MEVLIREMSMGDYGQVRELWKEAEGIEVTSVDSQTSIPETTFCISAVSATPRAMGSS